MTDSREYPSRPICAVGVVVRKDDSVLLIQRGNPPRRGSWSLPGGAVELGELVREAARREVLEECGIEVDLGELIDAVDLTHKDDEGQLQFHYVVIDFAGRYASGTLHAASDVLDARWVAPGDLGAYDLPAKTQQVIDRAMKTMP